MKITKICDARGKYPRGDILTSNQKRKRNNPVKSVPGRLKASALKLLCKNVQIVCLKFKIRPFRGQKGMERRENRWEGPQEG